MSEENKDIIEGDVVSETIIEETPVDNVATPSASAYTNEQLYGQPNDNQSNYNQANYSQPNYGQPNYSANAKKPGIGMAIASLVLGIISFVFFCSCCNIIFAILSVIFGIVALCKYTGAGNTGMAITGIVLSVLSVLGFFAFWISISVGSEAFSTMITDEMAGDDSSLKEFYSQIYGEEFSDLLEKYGENTF